MSQPEPSTSVVPDAAAQPAAAQGAASGAEGTAADGPATGVTGDQAAGARKLGLDADGRERPRFVATFPDEPALNALVDAFERGNFAYVRSNASKVSAATSSEEVKAAAAELRRRIDPDPSVVLLLGLAAAVFSFLVLWVYL